MKKLIGLLLFFFWSNYTYSQSNIIIQKDYSIAIPENWIPLSNILIKELQEKNDIELRTYVIGYSKSDSFVINPPYFTANYNEIPGSENALFKDALRIQKDILKNHGHEGNFIVDSNLYNFYTNQNIGNLILYRGFSVGGNGILYLNYYSESLSSEEDKKQFLDILNSVKHNKKFLNRNLHLENAKEHEKKAGGHATYALLALGMFLVIYFLRKMMNPN